jgi:hypothetical protein
MSWTAWAFAYLYVIGALNGILTIGLDKECYGTWAPLNRILLATIFWPVLMPALFAIGRGWRRQ